MKKELKLCKKRPYSDPLLAGRMMAAVCFVGKNDKPGRLHVYWCEQHCAYHFGHTSSPVPVPWSAK